MPDENVDKWKQRGHLYLWKYLENTRNYPGWHLKADEVFTHSLADLIERMLAAKYDCRKSLTVFSPTKEILKVPNNRGGEASWRCPNILILKYQSTGIDDYLSLAEDEDTVIISADRQKLELLKDCALKTISGANDYSIEIEDTQLWFW